MQTPEINTIYQGHGDIEGQHGSIVELRNRLREELGEYNKLSPWRCYRSIAFQWLVIGLAIAFALHFEHWLAYLVAILVIATRQHALGVLGHDGCHYRIANNRTLNNFVANFFCWLPLWFTNSRYGYEHLAHHRFVNTDQDPYVADFRSNPAFAWPKSRREGAITLMRHFFGLEMPEAARVAKRSNIFSTTAPPLPKEEKITAAVFLTLLVIFLWLSNGWLDYLLLWMLPLLTVGWFIIVVRTIAEHIGMEDFSGIEQTRHVQGSWWERAIFAPCGINYHLAHHVFPAVPWYKLPALHARLMQEPAYNQPNRIKQRYFGRDSVWQDITY